MNLLRVSTYIIYENQTGDYIRANRGEESQKYKSMPPMAYKMKEKYYGYKKSDRIRYGWSQQSAESGVDGSPQGES